MNRQINYGGFAGGYGRHQAVDLMEKPVSDWTYEEVTKWLQSIKMESYADIFAKAGIDGEVVIEVTEHDLQVIGVKDFHCKVICLKMKNLLSKQKASNVHNVVFRHHHEFTLLQQNQYQR